MTGALRFWLALVLVAVGCGGSLDAGSDSPSPLPVDNRNPVVLCNDGPYDNWQGEYAMLLASKGTISLAGIIVGTSPVWTNLNDNTAGWRQMISAARDAGLKNIPDPKSSVGTALVQPSDGTIESTVPNRSEGAALIIDASKRLSHPYRPLVVVTGARLTDVADAYLMDRTVANRIVVLAWLGSPTKDGAVMGRPNGEMDTWADMIVAQRLRYVQISVSYDQTSDVSASLLPQLPSNAFTSWIRSKQSQILSDPKASDQISIAALAIPGLVSTVSKVSQKGSDSNNLPLLVNDTNGPVTLVSQITGALATSHFWQMLLDPTTFPSK